MNSFIGDFICKIDDKGRLLLPAAFKRALATEANNTFVIKKDIYERCLVLYPLNEWEKQIQHIRQRLNPYNKEHNIFLRGFFKGTAEVELDTTNRLLIPRRLLEEVEIDKEAVLAGQDGKIEIWNKERYETIITSDEFAMLAQKIMGSDI